MMGFSDRLPTFGRREATAIGIVTVVALALVPRLGSNALEDLLLRTLVFAILAISWNLLAGYAGQISLGHAAFFGIGAYGSAWLTTPGGAGLPGWLATHPIVAIVVGGLAAALLATVVGLPMFRLRGHYFAIGTLALGTIIQIVLNNSRTISGGATGYYVQNDFGATGVYYVAIVAVVAIFVATYYMKNGRLGLGMQAVRDDEDAANTLGANPLRYKMWAFIVSSFFAGVAGGLYAQYALYLNPSSTLGVGWTIDSLVIVILGGMGTMLGPLVGTVIFILIDEILADLAGALATTLEGLLIVLFVIFIPMGFWGFVQDRLSDPAGETDGSSGDGRADPSRPTESTTDLD